MCLLLVICFLHARRTGATGVAYLLGGFVFGLTLEYIEVLTGSYTYGHFHLMLGRAPLAIPICIGAGWAIIMYTARLFSDGLGLPLLAASALDTLLALNIDLSMDVVAYRLHMWHWSWIGTHLNPLTAQWFGIPYGNFIGWATVIFCYSAFSRLFEGALVRRRATALRSATVALLAFLCSQSVLFSTETFIYPFLRDHFGITSLHRILAIGVALFIALALGWRHRRRVTRPLAAIALWVPLWFHLFFISCFFATGFYRESAAMTAVACTNTLIGVIVHLYPWFARLWTGVIRSSQVRTMAASG